MNTSLKSSRYRRASLLVFFITLALSYPISHLDISLLDEGALLYVAERLTKGDVLYRDLVTGIMPGVYYVQALFFELFGYSIMTGRVLACLTLALNSALLYTISINFIKKRSALFVTLLFISTGLPTYWMPGYSQLSITFVLLSLLFFLRYLDSPRLLTIFISGAAAAAALLFKQNYGVFVTTGLGIILLARLITKRELKGLFIFTLSFSAPIILTGLYFYSEGALEPMVQYTFISLFQKAAAVYYLPYPILSRENPLFFTGELYNFIPFRNIAIWFVQEGMTKELWIKITAALIYLLPVLVIAASLLHTLLSIIGRKARWDEATLVVVSGLLFLGVFPRSDIHHLLYVIPPLFITGALLAEKLPLRGLPRIISSTGILTLITIFSLLCAASSYMPLFYNAPGKEKTALNIPRAYGIRVDHRVASLIRAVTVHIREHSEPDEKILVVPTGAMYYFLTSRESAVPYPLIMPGAMNEAEVIDTLESTKLPHIIYSDMSFDGETLSTHMPLIHEYIINNYHIDESYPLKETGRDAYVLRRGRARPEEITALNKEAEAALRGKDDKMSLYYDFVKRLSEAKSGVILGSGATAPLFRKNQVDLNAWLLKDAIMQRPGRNWTKVYTSFTTHIPADSALRFSIGLSPTVWSPWNGDGVLFEIYLYDIKSNNLEELFSRYIDPKNNMSERRWFTYLAGLKKYEGRDLIISFVTSGGPRFNLTNGKINWWRQIDFAGWGEAALLTPSRDLSSTVYKRGANHITQAELPRETAAKMARFNDISFFLKEKKDYPGDYDIPLALGLIYERSGKRDKAETEFSEALKIYPAGSEARLHLTKYAIKAGRVLEAKKLLSEGLKLSPKDAGLNLAAGNIYRRLKDHKKAIIYYRRSLRSRPGNLWSHLALASSYLALGQVSQAKAETEKALAVNPENASALILLGDTYRFKKEWKKAENSYRKALDKSPGRKGAAFKLGLTLAAEGRLKEARSIYEEILRDKNTSASLKRLVQKNIKDIQRDNKGEQ